MRSFQVPLLLIILTITVAGCSLADIRPDSIRTSISSEQFNRGRQILHRAVEAHGGKERWAKAGPILVEFRDEWPGALNRTLFMPWPESPISLSLYALPGKDDSRIEFRGSEQKGNFWGIQNWVPYTVDSEGLSWKPDNDTLKFWLPTLNYFLQLPFRIDEADVVAYAGERSLDGRMFDLVFVSWGQAAPQEKIDQYLLWIERKTGYIEYATYTVRDMGSFITGTMHYSNFTDVDGLVLATDQQVIDSPEEPGDPLHHLHIENIKLNASVAEDFFYPSPDRQSSKH